MGISRRRIVRCCVAVTIAALGACAGSDAPGDAPGAGQVATHRPDTIDSILPMSEYLARFRRGSTAPDGLSGGAASPDSLAARVLRAAAARDAAQLRALTVTRAEFGWVVFPRHRYHEPPYEMDPALFWLRLDAATTRGIQRLVDRFGGRAPLYTGVRCQSDSLQSSDPLLEVWSHCEVRFQLDGEARSESLFGSIVAWGDRMKLLSLAD